MCSLPMTLQFQPTQASTIPDGHEVKFTMDVSCVAESYEFKWDAGSLQEESTYLKQVHNEQHTSQAT